MKLYAADMQRIIRSLPKDVVKALKEADGKLFLAGGFIRARIAGEQVSDIDLWGANKNDLGIMAELFAAKRGVRAMKTDNAYTILAEGRSPVQFITRWTFDTPEQCCESFDFTIASAAIWYKKDNTAHDQMEGEHKWGGTWESYCHEDFYRDLASKSLVYTCPTRNEDAGGSMMRVQKFLHKGYSISPGNLSKVIARLAMGVRFIASEAKTEEWLAQLLLGLLREVDPLCAVDGVELEDEVLSAELQAQFEEQQVPKLNVGTVGHRVTVEPTFPPPVPVPAPRAPDNSDY